MMKKIILAILVLGVAIMVVPKYVAHGEPNDDFIIVNADDTNYLSMTASTDLNTLIANVADRFVYEHANADRFYDLVSVPGELETLLGQIDDRFVISYANANKFYSLGYPVDLIGDDTPPQAGNPTVTGNSFNSVKISWTTNEYTTSILEYGIQSGVYPHNVTDNLYKIQHNDLLSGLTPGETYYYRITDTDRSGNTFQSQERTFNVIVTLYLPFVKR